MKKSKKIIIIFILILSIIMSIKINKVFAYANIETENNIIKDEKLTYRKQEDGEILISGFKIGEKVSEILERKFIDGYNIKIKNNQGIDITNQLDTKIGTGNKIELYEKNEEILVRIYTVVIYGDTNGDTSIGAVDALAVVKNKIGKEEFKNKALEEAGRILSNTRQLGSIPKADDALYIIKNKLHPETYKIEQEMLKRDEEEKVINGDNIDGIVNGTMNGKKYNYNNPVIPVGFKTKDIENINWNSTDEKIIDNWNKGLVIEDKYGNEFIWIPINEENVEYKKFLANNENITDIEKLGEDILPNRITNEHEQIEKYGGFYISKYEAGIPESMTEAINTASADKRNVVGIPTSKKEQITWNHINYDTAKINAEKMYRTKKIQSGLVTGTQWDMLVKWLETINTNKPIINTLSVWTTEKYEQYRIARGKVAEDLLGKREKELPTQTNENIGFRIILYIQEESILENIDNNITMNVETTTPRNTLSTGTHNGIEKGSIKIDINFGETNLQKQYKKETEENWITVNEASVQIEVTENTTIIARYYDGKNSYKTTSVEIQNVDNISPTFNQYTATVNGKTITVLADATDTANVGAYPGTEGILRYEYSINGIDYQTQNTFTVNTGGNYTIYIKAIDKAGNETIVNKNVSVNEYTINFNTTGGNVNLTNKKVIQNSEYGELPVPTKAGYGFSGWFTQENGGTKIESTTIANITENQTLYAHWENNKYTLTIKHYLENANNAEYTLIKTNTETISYGTEITLANYKQTIQNGTYKQGTITENGTAIPTNTLNGNTTIYLYYSRNRYTLTLNKGDYIDTVTGAGEHKVGQNIIINATLKANATGYINKWANWTSNNTNLIANTNIQNTTITMPAGNVTLTANGIRTANKYTLTVKHYLENANNTNYTLNKTTTTENVVYGTQIVLANYKTEITYGTYSYGSLVEATTGATSNKVTTTSMGQNMTICLYYSRNTYKVTLQAGNNITKVSGGGNCKIGSSIQISATVPSGYMFVTWRITSGTGTVANLSSDSTTVTPTSNVTLTSIGAQAIAQVGTKKYTSIQSAIDSITNSTTQTTIQVLVSHNITSNLNNKKNIILNLGGKTLTTEGYISNNGTLQINNGTITSNNANHCIYNSNTLTIQSGAIIRSSNTEAIFNNTDGQLTINGALIEYTPTMVRANYAIINNGRMTMNSGTIKVDGDYGCILNKTDKSTSYIYGGTIDGKNATSSTIYNYGTITIGKIGDILNIYGSNTKNVSGNTATIYNSEGTVTVINGNIYGYSNIAIRNDYGNLNINGGNISNNSNLNTIDTIRGTLIMTSGTIINSGTGYTIYNNNGTARKTGGTAVKTYGVS